MKRVAIAVLPLTCMLLLPGCKKDKGDMMQPDNTVSSVTVTSPQNNFNLNNISIVQLQAQAANANGDLLGGISFTWSSSDQAIATVDANGLLTLLVEGNTTITATASGVSGTLVVNVTNDPMPQVTIVAPQTDFMFGALVQPQFQAVVVDTNGQVVPNAVVQWSSNDPSIVMIDAMGNITALQIGLTEVTATYANATSTQVVAVIPPTGIADFNIESNGIVLRSSIDMPSGNGPFPAVVLVHGSGTATRQTLQIYSDILTDGGIAVLIYDKRGTGDSGGIFFEVEPSNAGTQRIGLLAEDALAALEFMRLHDQVQADHVGLFGFSQGGWVVPHAASMSNSVDFLVHVVGPVCTVGEEGFYSALTAGGTSVADANMQVSNFTGFHGYDPVPDLQTNVRPGLWVLGGQDASIPTAVSIDRLNVLINAGKPYTIDLKPNGNHFLQDVNTGQQISYLTPTGGVIDWILDVVD